MFFFNTFNRKCFFLNVENIVHIFSKTKKVSGDCSQELQNSFLSESGNLLLTLFWRPSRQRPNNITDLRYSSKLYFSNVTHLLLIVEKLISSVMK
jgi:hypothetical protein